jgi:hypothetical protein
MSLSEVSEELAATVISCIFGRKIAGEAGDLRVYSTTTIVLKVV